MRIVLCLRTLTNEEARTVTSLVLKHQSCCENIHNECVCVLHGGVLVECCRAQNGDIIFSRSYIKISVKKRIGIIPLSRGS